MNEKTTRSVAYFAGVDGAEFKRILHENDVAMFRDLAVDWAQKNPQLLQIAAGFSNIPKKYVDDLLNSRKPSMDSTKLDTTSIETPEIHTATTDVTSSLSTARMVSSSGATWDDYWMGVNYRVIFSCTVCPVLSNIARFAALKPDSLKIDWQAPYKVFLDKNCERTSLRATRTQGVSSGSLRWPSRQ